MMGDRDRSPRRDRRQAGAGAGGKTKRGPPDRRIFVSNLPFEMKWQEVKDLFRKEVGEVSYVELFDDESGKPRGAGVMEFPTAEMAKKAVEKMHRHEYRGRKIVVKEDFDAERDKCGRIIGRRGEGVGGVERRRSDRGDMGELGGPGGQGYGETFGLSPQFLESLNITGPLHQRIFVANMDYKVDEKKLKEVFRLAGKGQGVELSRDKEGKSRGFATIVYDHPVEAVQAISMFNNQQLFDRKMSVRFDKVPEEEPPRNPNRLPEGLGSVGMGLGQDGMPLLDVRANLPSGGQDGGQGGGGMGGGGGNMGGGNMGNMGGQQQGSSAATVGTAALQAALATIMGMGGGAGNNGANNGMGGNGMGSNMGMGGSGGSMGGPGGNMGSMGGMGGQGNMGGPSGNMGGQGGNMGGPSGSMGAPSGNMGGIGGNMGAPSSSMGMMNSSSSSMGGMGGSLNRSMSIDRASMGGGGGMDRGMGESNGRGRWDGPGMGGGGNSMGGSSANSMADGYGSSSYGAGSAAGSGGGAVRRSDSIIVRNLSYDCNWQALKDNFHHVGDIKYAEMKDRGVGVVR